MPAQPSFVISLPIADRYRAMEFYRDALGLDPVGEPEADGVPEPLQFQLDERTTLMLIPAGGFGWVLGERDTAPHGVSECILSLVVATEQDVVEAVSRMRDAGAEVITEPARQAWGFAALTTDLDGHAWQIITA